MPQCCQDWGRLGGTAGDWRGQPHGWNVRTNKGLSPEALCHQQLRKSRVSGSNPCPSGVRHSSAAAAGRCVRCTSGRTTSAAVGRTFTCQSIGVSARFSSVIGEHQQRRIRYTSLRPVRHRRAHCARLDNHQRHGCNGSDDHCAVDPLQRLLFPHGIGQVPTSLPSAAPRRGVRRHLWVAGDYRHTSLLKARSLLRSLPLLRA